MWSIIKRIVTFVFSLDQSQPLYVYFCPFIITISIIQIEESVDGVLGFEPGPQDGRRRRNHRAIVKFVYSIRPGEHLRSRQWSIQYSLSSQCPPHHFVRNILFHFSFLLHIIVVVVITTHDSCPTKLSEKIR